MLARRREAGDVIWPLWLGRVVLVVVFIVLMLGGGAGRPEMLVAGLVMASLAGASWLLSPTPLPLRGVAVPAVMIGASLSVAMLTVMPFVNDGVRPGMFAPVAGNSLSIAPLETLREIAKILVLGCGFVCGAAAACGRRNTARATVAVIVGICGWALWAIFLNLQGGLVARLAAPFLSPNTAATVLGMGLVLIVGRIANRILSPAPNKVRVPRLIGLGAGFCIVATALTLTQSRAGVLITAICALGLAASWPGMRLSRTRRQWIWYGVAGLVALVAANLGWSFVERLQLLGNDASDRRTIFGAYASAFQDAPLFGSGLGSAPYITKLALTPENYQALWNVQSAHNWLLQWLAEGGVLAAAPMFAGVGGLVFTAYRGLNRKSAVLLLPLLFCDLLILMHGLVDFALQIPGVALLWSFLLGLQVAVASGGSDNHHAGSASVQHVDEDLP